MYNKPMTEVMDLKTARLMAGVTVSQGSGADPTAPPIVQMPQRGDIIE